MSERASQKELEVSSQFTYADILVDYLTQFGVEYVFGVPGGAIEALFNALARRQERGGPQIIVARHECGAAFMADGYYRETGKMAAVCTTTGPGATNLVTGVCSAMADHIPMLLITAQTPLPRFGRGALQESSCTAIDTVAILRYCTAYSSLVSHPDQLENKIISAWMAAHRFPRSPVHLSIPSDILNTVGGTPRQLQPHLFDLPTMAVDQNVLDRLWQTIRQAETVAVYMDGDVGVAARTVVAFCELVNAPFVVGPNGKYWIDEHHPLYRGVYGFAGHSSAEDVLMMGKPDVILAVGCDLTELSTLGWNEHLLNPRLIHIDANAEHFTRSPMAAQHVCADPGRVFDALLTLVAQHHSPKKSWHGGSVVSPPINLLGSRVALNAADLCFDDTSPIKPQRFMHYFTRILPPDARVYLDAGNTWAWMTHYFVNRDYQGRVRVGTGFASMGWGIGAAIGSAFANPNHLTVCITGDGAYLMSAQELSVAAQHHLPLIMIVLNDAALGMVMHGQRMSKSESVGWELNTIDYALQAYAMGVVGYVIRTVEELEAIDFARLQAVGGPVLLDVRIDRDVVPPIGQRIKDLGNRKI